MIIQKKKNQKNLEVLWCWEGSRVQVIYRRGVLGAWVLVSTLKATHRARLGKLVPSILHRGNQEPLEERL